MSFQQSPKPQQSHQPQSQPFDGHQSPESLGYEDDSNFQGSSVASNEPSGLSRFLMFGLVVLALLASVLMLLMDSDGWLKVALIAALWAAFFGVVLVLRYSGALKLAREQAENQESYFQSQLEHERAQLEKREAATQAKYAAEAKKSQDQRDKHLEELRAELAHMRKQLAELTGENFDEGEQRAVRATAERVRELGHSVGGQAPQAAGSSAGQTAGQQQSAGQQEAQPHKAQHRSKPKFNTGTFAAVNWTGQDSEETSQLPLVVDTTAMDEAKRAEHKATQQKPTQPKPAQKRRAQMPSAEAVRPSRARTGAAQDAGAQDAAAKQGEQTEATATTHGRRRADEVENGLTVAELMQRFKNREK
ncbi:hypothetical protein HMPREF3166_00790 [Corynebacterium sp. HMSC08A12]|uniref:DUF6779 domain-containing protein n=1 Tax=Corynebacterium sp. HMSC08A12 TaxID=1581134 RepID=UPI0008A643F6|nr:DUF6779 domain-containing protein [Corynebacterium sp. HMSC08A12]OFT36596.1 hypothetical protein HMPREF3166_00790 [Corynebacterium sp. HMSC08A12]